MISIQGVRTAVCHRRDCETWADKGSEWVPWIKRFTEKLWLLLKRKSGDAWLERGLACDSRKQRMYEWVKGKSREKYAQRD